MQKLSLSQFKLKKKEEGGKRHQEVINNFHSSTIQIPCNMLV